MRSYGREFNLIYCFHESNFELAGRFYGTVCPLLGVQGEALEKKIIYSWSWNSFLLCLIVKYRSGWLHHSFPIWSRYWFRIYFLQFVSTFFCLVIICCLLIIVSEQDDSFQSNSVRLDGKNYLCWSYVIKNFVNDKKMWIILLTLYINLWMNRTIRCFRRKQFENYHLN